jgi:acetyl-CoA carboxylase biotin carboxyl carrier protein
MNMDEQFILTIMEKFNGSSIFELTLDDGTTRMVLRKGTAALPAGAAVSAGRGLGAPEEAPVHLGISANPVHSVDGEKITSPIVATFYASPSPDAPSFVKPGAKIKAGQTLCILEAMKMMNHLEAEFDCEIKETHVNSGELVEYGQILFTVKKL